MNRVFLLVVIIFFAHSASGQTAPEYIRLFEEATSAETFRTSFDAMINRFHSGKLKFEHHEVKKIVSIAQRKPFANSLLPAVFGWARTMYANGRVQEGLTFFMQSADRYQQQGNKVGEAVSYHEIAIIQHKAENLAEAEKYYRLAIANGIEILPYRMNIDCLNGLAMILRDHNKTDLAATEFRRALGIAVVQKDTAWIGILAGNIGSCHLAQQNYDSSLWYYNRNLFFIRRTGEFENEIETYINLGRVYLHKKNWAFCKLYVDSAAHIVESRKIVFNDFFNPMDYIHETYSKLYSATGDFEKAYENYVKFHTIKDQKQLKINARSLKQLESVWQFEKNQNEIDLLRKINQQQRYISGAFVVIIILLGGISFYVLRMARRRKSINRQLSATNTELGRLNEVKDMLFSVISHDLRGPIANLKSTLNLLKKGNLTPDELFMLVERLGMQLEISGGALENILQWAKAQLNNMAINPSRIRLKGLTELVLTQLSLDLSTKNITVINQISDDAIAHADKDQLEVVIRNLITNGIKFTSSGGSIWLSAKQNDGIITITVRDNGVGMTSTQLENLFKPNRHSSTQGTNKEKGTGIGLIIAREMVLANGGKIWAESEPDRGSSFHVSIPSS